MPEVLPALLWFALLLYAYAIVYGSRQLTEALFKPIIALAGSIPYLAGILVKALTAIEQAISDAFGVVESKIDTAIGASWHLCARLMDDTWRELENHARDIFALANLIGPFGAVIATVRNTARALQEAYHGIEHGVRDLRKLWNGIEHRVKQLEHDLTRGIGHDLRLSLKADEKALHHLERKVIPSIRGDVATAEGEIGNLFDWIRGKADIIGAGTFVGAVAAALTAVGNGWLGCKENPFTKSSNPCGLWSDLARLMPLLGLLALAFDFPEFVKAAELVAEEIGPSVSRIEGSVLSSLPALPPPI